MMFNRRKEYACLLRTPSANQMENAQKRLNDATHKEKRHEFQREPR